ncbi:MAG: LpqB family beta-propeller domain-containing protein [Streptosporangiaceae bacterium]
MPSRPPRLSRLWLSRLWLPQPRLAWLRRAAVVLAAVVSLAGCVSMPDSGPVGQLSATPEATTPRPDYVGMVPYGPGADWSPLKIVQGFLVASAGYQAYAGIARQYLTNLASRTWDPGWNSAVYDSFSYSGDMTAPAQGPASVTVSGSLQAAFSGTGQFVSVVGTAKSQSGWPFQLAKVDGQWRITNPPPQLLLTKLEFNQLYQPQDVYFASPEGVLVPESVFVPLGASETSLATNLVKVLLNGLTPKSWLYHAALTIPAGTTFGGVTLDGTTAVVSLGGAIAHESQALKEQVSAQLAWTLGGPSSGSPQNISSIELVINGQPWTPPRTLCGVPQSRSSVQNQAMYSCWDPFPVQTAGFAFISNGHLLARCASEQSAQQGRIGPVVSVFSTSARQPCGTTGSDVPTTSTTAPSAAAPSAKSLPAFIGSPAMAAVSPGGSYVATYTKGSDVLAVGSSANPSGLVKVRGSNWNDVTALSWDQDNDLWVAQGGAIYLVTTAGTSFSITAPMDVTDLSVAPDGVRIALVEQDGSQSQVELAAINRPSGPSGTPGSLSIGDGTQLGPNLTYPDALSWYDANNLIVLDGAGATRSLAEVSVDGQDVSSTQPAPANAISIAAYGPLNALVAGLAVKNGALATSAGLESTWQPLGVTGQDPSYFG